MLGQTRPIKLKANRFGCYLSPLIKRQVCGGDFETTVQRSDWGINWGIPFGFENKVRLLVQVEAVNYPVRSRYSRLSGASGASSSSITRSQKPESGSSVRTCSDAAVVADPFDALGARREAHAGRRPAA